MYMACTSVNSLRSKRYPIMFTTLSLYTHKKIQTKPNQNQPNRKPYCWNFFWKTEVFPNSKTRLRRLLQCKAKQGVGWGGDSGLLSGQPRTWQPAALLWGLQSWKQALLGQQELQLWSSERWPWLSPPWEQKAVIALLQERKWKGKAGSSKARNLMA